MSTAHRVGWLCSRLCLALALLAIVGCAFFKPVNDPQKDILSQEWQAAESNRTREIETNKVIIDGLATQFDNSPQPPTRPLNILALSAGGKYAAFAAGLLHGWSEHGSRPQFDIVTGVSSGAILSLYAFLGPQYDCKLKQFFTTVDQRDLFPIRPIRNLAVHGSLAYPHGLKRIIDEEVNATLFGELCAAHRAGRRIYLATMNVQTKRLVVWDVGGLACSGRPDALELVRKVILASTAVPGLLPPVEFDVMVNGKKYVEQHCDGGTVTQNFVRFGPNATPMPGKKWLAGSHLYCLAAGKLEPDPLEGRRPIGKRVAASISSSLYALYKAELLNLYALCTTSGMQFNLASIPQDVLLDIASTRIESDKMKPLYEMGYQMAVRGPVWRQTPPGSIPGEEPPPRTGTTFQTVPTK